MIFKKLLHSKKTNNNISKPFEESPKEESLCHFQEMIYSTPKYKIVEEVISVLEKKRFLFKKYKHFRTMLWT